MQRSLDKDNNKDSKDNNINDKIIIYRAVILSTCCPAVCDVGEGIFSKEYINGRCIVFGTCYVGGLRYVTPASLKGAGSHTCVFMYFS